MRTTAKRLSMLAALACVAGLYAGAAQAADNAEIVIIDQQHRATPFGRYHSRRSTRVYGPESGFRYEEYQTPVQPVYPRYRHYRGYSSGRYHRRVIEHPGYRGYTRYGAPVAPGVRGYRYGGDAHRGRAHHPHHRPTYAHGRQPGSRAITPAQRAIDTPRRAIRNDRR